jgi:hypothetical protein
VSVAGFECFLNVAKIHCLDLDLGLKNPMWLFPPELGMKGKSAGFHPIDGKNIGWRLL